MTGAEALSPAAMAVSRRTGASAPSPDSPNVAWLIASLVLVAAPHAQRLPLWITLLGAVLMAWRLYISARGRPLPGRWILLPLTFAGIAGIYFSFGSIFGRNPGVAMLLMLIALKLLEMRSLRDAMLVVFLSYFLVITNFLYSQEVPTALYMMGVVFVITLSLLRFNCMAGVPPLAARLRLATVLLAQSIPLMLVLFLLFPRLPGPLWALPRDALGGVTGLSDTMSPGSLSALSLSDEVAFRVNFSDSVPPPPSRMYWRGPVMEEFDGQTWRVGEGRFQGRPQDLEFSGSPVRYQVTLEPHYRPWILALEMPSNRPRRTGMRSDYSLLAFTPVRTRMRYEMVSYYQYRAGLKEPAMHRTRNLALPTGFNPRARELAETWRVQAPDPDGVVQRALSYFRAEPFAYTLQPPLLGRHGVDDFLFKTRSGFCEHYASAFTFLMRAAGIPARVVTGYQGGEFNMVGDYLIVRQADAHAWSEVWLRDRGWVRIDPTAAVAPERVQSGIAEALPASDPLPYTVRGSLAWLVELRLQLDTLAFRWDQWVLGYGPERQYEFLSRAGMTAPDWRSMAVGLLTGTGVLLLVFALWMLRRPGRGVPDPAQAAYLRFCQKLARAGVPRRAGEGPRDFAERATSLRPEIGPAVEGITDLYVALRYGRGAGPEQFRRLRELVSRFRA